MSYQPGEKNAKADALSRVYGSPASTTDPDSILPASYSILSDLFTGILSPSSRRRCAQNRRHLTHLPTGLMSPHQYGLSSSSGVTQHWDRDIQALPETAQLLSQKYWWNSLATDVQDYVLSCPVCAQAKTPRQLPAGELVPLPTPQRPWSHVAVDFLTVCEGFTTILVLIDRFSKMCRFIPLPNLPQPWKWRSVVFSSVPSVWSSRRDVPRLEGILQLPGDKGEADVRV